MSTKDTCSPQYLSTSAPALPLRPLTCCCCPAKYTRLTLRRTRLDSQTASRPKELETPIQVHQLVEPASHLHSAIVPSKDAIPPSSRGPPTAGRCPAAHGMASSGLPTPPSIPSGGGRPQHGSYPVSPSPPSTSHPIQCNAIHPCHAIPSDADPVSDAEQNGGYVNPPRVKRQFRDPHADWWDKQERRNYGEPVHEDNDVLAIFSPHEYTHTPPGKGALQLLAFVAATLGLAGAISLVYPDRPAVEREFPDGLEEELGGKGAVRVSLLPVLCRGIRQQLMMVSRRERREMSTESCQMMSSSCLGGVGSHVFQLLLVQQCWGATLEIKCR